MSKSKKVAFYGIFTALAIIMGYVESMVPVPVPIPGIKLGLANVITVIVLYYMGAKASIGISLIRIFVSSLLFSGFAGFLYSLAGCILSIAVMIAAKRTDKFGINGISMLGGVAHNTGQIVVACLVVNNFKLMLYYPALLISGVITGLIVGVVAGYSLDYIKKIIRN